MKGGSCLDVRCIGGWGEPIRIEDHFPDAGRDVLIAIVSDFPMIAFRFNL